MMQVMGDGGVYDNPVVKWGLKTYSLSVEARGSNPHTYNLMN